MCFVSIYFAEGIVSYSIPKGVQRGMEVDLSDKTYDGYEQGDRFVDGLGQLVDGQKGKDNFRTDIHGFGKGEWVFCNTIRLSKKLKRKMWLNFNIFS